MYLLAARSLLALSLGIAESHGTGAVTSSISIIIKTS